MYRGSQEKENSHVAANRIDRKPWVREFLSKTEEKASHYDDNDVQENSSDENSSHKIHPLVDEVHKTVVHYHKKDKKHIGEEAFVPITLEVLKDTLNRKLMT